MKIALKYPCKVHDGSTVWAGLLATKDSANIWSRLLSKQCEFLELGVFMGELDHDESSFGPPLIGVNGVPLKMYFHRAKSSSWTHATHIAAPSTYTVPSVILL